MNFAALLPAFEAEFHTLLADRYPEGERKMLLRLLLEKQDPQTITPEDWQQLHQATDRLLKGEPIQYITGWGHFYGREFRVEPGVLIPRGETEELMVMIRDWGQKLSQSVSPKVRRKLQGLDIGTGTGCIPTSLELEWQNVGIESQLHGVDISQKAVYLAQWNATHLGAQLNFTKGDVFQLSPTTFHRLDFVVSNPPYIPMRESAEMDQHVVAHEPQEALFVPDEDPLLFYRIIGQKALSWLRIGGKLFFEIHRDFGIPIKELLQEQGYQHVQLLKDLNRNHRFIVGTK